MRILFDARVLGHSPMHGIARYTLNLLHQLLKEDRGHEYLILIGDSSIQGWFAPSVPVHWIQNTTPLYSLQEQVLLPGQLRKVSFDLFHSPTYTIPVVFCTKGIITIHDLIHLLFPGDYGLGHRLFYRLIVRRAVARCLKVFTVSEHSKNDIILHLRGREPKIAVTYNGLDLHWRTQTGDLRFLERQGLKERYILFVGNPRPHKNFLRLRAAFEQFVEVDKYEGKLVVVGVNPRDFPGQSGGRLVFLPHCNDQELQTLYSQADLLASPSLYEGFGLPVLEAMACGCPVLIGNQGSLPEIVGEAGLKVDPYDIQSIHQGMREILYHKGLAQTLQDRGLKQAALYSWERTGQKVLETYDDLNTAVRTLNAET